MLLNSGLSEKQFVFLTRTHLNTHALMHMHRRTRKARHTIGESFSQQQYYISLKWQSLKFKEISDQTKVKVWLFFRYRDY